MKKTDELYTQLNGIEKELTHYIKHFKDKIVFCNCNDSYESNFFKYFVMNFNRFGLKKLICTSYCNSATEYTKLNMSDNGKAYKIEITEVNNKSSDGSTNFTNIKYLLKNKENSLTFLNGNGDFRSEECIKLLKQADIIVTNPPFSLFRGYIVILMSYNKKFLIIGNKKAISYKEIFPLIKENKIWSGYNNGEQTFKVPNSFDGNNTFIKEGIKYAKLDNICWFTNLKTAKKRTITII